VPKNEEEYIIWNKEGRQGVRSGISLKEREITLEPWSKDCESSRGRFPGLAKET
jgi:hypothetical protein